MSLKLKEYQIVQKKGENRECGILGTTKTAVLIFKVFSSNRTHSFSVHLQINNSLYII